MKKLIQRGLIFLFVITSSVHGLVYYLQDSLLFFPTKNNSFQASNYKHVKEIRFDRESVVLSGYLVHEDKASKGVVFYFGGNAEDVAGAIADYTFIKDKMLVLFNYRGYGDSTGEPSQDNLLSDASYIYTEILKNYPTEKVYIIGRSLGTGVASYLAAKEHVDRLCLVTPYDSILSIAKRNYPFLWVEFLLKHPFRSDEWVRGISHRITVIAALNDRVIPQEHTERLIENMSEKPIFHKIKDADHNNLIYLKEYKDAIRNFLRD